jgi:hypothetical protein
MTPDALVQELYCCKNTAKNLQAMKFQTDLYRQAIVRCMEELPVIEEVTRERGIPIPNWVENGLV